MSDSLSLPEQLVKECEAMAHYAFTSGIKIPASVIQMLNICDVAPSVLVDEIESSAESKEKESTPPSSSEKSISLSQIATLHGALAKIVEPATPRTILLIYEERQKKNLWTFLGAVPLVGKFMFAAILFLIGWILISLSPTVDGNLDWTRENGLHLLLEELFVFFAAAIGACFSILFQVNRFVVRGTYDPKYDSTYWTRLVLGIVAGMILALMIPLNTAGSLKMLTKPTLALLGGFSVTVVYRIMMRLVAAVESLVKGETADVIEAQLKVAQAESDVSQTEERMQLSTSLMGLRAKINSDQNKQELTESIDQILKQLMPTAAATETQVESSQ